MKPNLIIPLMGKRRKKLFSLKNFFFNNKYSYLINHICSNFTFCNKIIIICRKQDKKYIKFRNISKLKFIYLRSSYNQINTIQKCEKKLNNKNPLLILNPDSFFSFLIKGNNLIRKLRKSNIVFFGIKDYQKEEIINQKDTFKVYKNKLISINIKDDSSNNKKKIVSAGLYYFKNINLFLKLCNKFNKKSKLKNSKFQIAHLIKLYLKSKYSINYVLVENFVDFADEKKIQEFFFWQKFFRENIKKRDKLNSKNIFNIIPSAGEGSRHKKLGYNKPKPLIPIGERTMFEKSLDKLPNKNNNLFIFRKHIFNKFNIKKIFIKNKSLNDYFLINRKTKGMAETILLSKNKIPFNRPVIISSCDISFIINYKKFYKVLSKKPDGIIFTWRNYPFADESPNSHAYVKVKNEKVTLISEKKTISNRPNNDFAVTGIFYFKSSELLLDCISHMIKNRITVNREYYVATSMSKLLKDNLKIYNFEVDQFISWSLPEHLKMYNKWEKIFK